MIQQSLNLQFVYLYFFIQNVYTDKKLPKKKG